MTREVERVTREVVTNAALAQTVAGRVGSVVMELGRGASALRRLVGDTRQGAAQRLALEQLKFLSEASLVLSGSLVPQRIIDITASLAVQRLGEGAVVFLRDGDAVTLGGVVHHDGRFAENLRDLVAANPPELASDHGPGLVLRTGQTWHEPYVTDCARSPAPVGDLAGGTWSDFLAGPTITVSMPGQGRILGSLTVFRRSRTYTPVDIRLAEHLARRAATALDNAQRYTAEQESTLTLQRSLLPGNPPALCGLEVAMEYRPGTAGTEVGGDLYDVIPLPDGRVGIAIGDVMGRGLRAAAVMGQLRAALRAYALEDWAPAELLSRLNRVVDSLPGLHLATCMYIVYDPATTRATLSNAGHLPPLLVLPGEEPDYLAIDPGLPLGVGDNSGFVETSLKLPPGSGIVLYTDGLVESRRQPLDDGMARLRRALRATMDDSVTRAGSPAGAALSASGSARALLQRCLTASEGAAETSGEALQADDDVALLVMTTQPLRPALLELALPAESTSARRARCALGDRLATGRLAAVCENAVLLVSEVVTNAVRHARTDLVLRAHNDGSRLRVSVEDREAARMPRRESGDDDRESGWGLLLVDVLADCWGVQTTPDGKRVWFDLNVPAGTNAA